MVEHIAYIMDGNRRYSKDNSMSKEDGYRAGMLKFLDFVRWQIKYNIKETSYFALSSDNYEKRPISEKKILYGLMNFFSKDKSIKDFFIQNKIKIRLIGDIDSIKYKEKLIPDENRLFIENYESEFEQWNKESPNPSYYVNIAINYDGQKEIVDSCKKILQKINSNELDLNEINEDTLKNNMYTNLSKAPEIIVRPGNAPRLSGFFLWDSKYSEIYLTKKMWPELEEIDFLDILDWYKNIERNFGK